MRLALPGLLAAFILSMNAGAGWSQEEDDLLTFNSYCRQCHVTNEGDHRLGPSLYGIVGKEDKIDLSICNPPFHSSVEDAQKGTQRKVKNLSGKDAVNPTLNFAGVSNELIYAGGEYKFIQNMIKESKKFAKNFCWFSTLVSKQSNLKGTYKSLEKLEAKQIRTIPMGTGNKSTRIVAWTFLSEEEQKEWAKTRW